MLYGRSDIESLVPYQPFITALQHYIAHRDTLEFPAELEPELGELARFVPALRRLRHAAARAVGEEDELRRYRMFEAVTRMLAFIARERPMVLVIDDLHWADRSTGLLLEHLLRDPELTRLLVLGTERAGARSREPLRRRFTRLALTGPRHDRHGAAGGHAGRARLGHRPAAGADRGQPAVPDRDAAQPRRRRARRTPSPEAVERALSELAVPEGVKQLIGHRIGRLSEAAGDLLERRAR